LTFVSIQAGGGSACGITSNADVYCWGDNTAGDLGNGTTTSSLVPVKVLFTLGG
jgi:alpha-tubulin suppressor-like RCC1 family protein